MKDPVMTTATKTIKFDAAHVLTNHEGLCKNLHGHTYRVDVTVAQSANDTKDMVIDFKDLKRISEETILVHFDHAFIYDSTSAAESEIASVVAKHGMRAVALPVRSTAENLARHFFSLLAPSLPGLRFIRVWETPESCAEYSKE